MSGATDKAVDLALKYWEKPITVVALCILVTGGLLYTLAAEDPSDVSNIGWALIALAPVTITAFWLATNRIPRTPKGMIGLVIAIAAEDEQQHERVRADFTRHLHELLAADGSVNNFAVIEYPARLAARLTDAEIAKRYQMKSRAHFVAYGRVRTRQYKGVESTILTMRGAVRHAQVSNAVRAKLAAEFFLPNGIALNKAAEFEEFEVTSEWFEVAVRYIVGVAALASGDVRYAETLLLSVQERVKVLLSVQARVPTVAARGPSLREIQRRLPGHLRSLYAAWLLGLSHEHLRTRDVTLVEEAERIATSSFCSSRVIRLRTTLKPMLHSCSEKTSRRQESTFRH